VLYTLPGNESDILAISHVYSPNEQINGYYQTGLSPAKPASFLLDLKSVPEPANIFWGSPPSIWDVGGLPKGERGQSLFDASTYALGPITGSYQAGAPTVIAIRGSAPTKPYGPELVQAGVSGLDAARARAVRVSRARPGRTRRLADYEDYDTDLAGLGADKGRGRMRKMGARRGVRRRGLHGLSRGGGVAGGGRGLTATDFSPAGETRGMTSMTYDGSPFTGLSDIFSGFLTGVKAIVNPLTNALTDREVQSSLLTIGGRTGDVLANVGRAIVDVKALSLDQLKKLGTRAALEEYAYRMKQSTPIPSQNLSTQGTTLQTTPGKPPPPSFWARKTFGISNAFLAGGGGLLLLFFTIKKK